MPSCWPPGMHHYGGEESWRMYRDQPQAQNLNFKSLMCACKSVASQPDFAFIWDERFNFKTKTRTFNQWKNFKLRRLPWSSDNRNLSQSSEPIKCSPFNFKTNVTFEFVRHMVFLKLLNITHCSPSCTCKGQNILSFQKNQKNAWFSYRYN